MLEVPATTHGNIAVLAFQNKPELNIEKLKKRAGKLSDHYDLDFFRMLMDMKGKNRHNDKKFSILNHSGSLKQIGRFV